MPRAVNKKDRVPVGGRHQKLQLSDADMRGFRDRGRVPRWFNDKDGRVEAAINGGWVFATPEEAPSIGRAQLHQENTDLNEKVSKVVSRGEGMVIRAYLMHIAKEWYDEDQERKEDRNRAIDRLLLPVEEGGQSIEGGYTPK